MTRAALLVLSLIAAADADVQATAKKLKLGMSPEAVENATEAFGKPKLSFQWCRHQTSCIDLGEREGRASKMDASWWIEDDEGGHLALMTSFCGGLGKWRLGDVALLRWPKKKAAWGTFVKPRILHEKRSDTFFDDCWKP